MQQVQLTHNILSPLLLLLGRTTLSTVRRDVTQRFRLLIQKKAIPTIDEIVLDSWLDPDNAERWAWDEVNLVTDVRVHVSTLATNAGIPPATRYSLDLLIAFEHATPNNTLSLL